MRLLLLTLLNSVFCFCLWAQQDSLVRFRRIAIHENCSKFIIDGSNRACFKRHITAHVEREFVYPEEALIRNIEAKLEVSFSIEKDGRVTDIELTKKSRSRYFFRFWKRKYARLIDEEALRVIGLLEFDAVPVEGGKPVTMHFSQPISVEKELIKELF